MHTSSSVVKPGESLVGTRDSSRSVGWLELVSRFLRIRMLSTASENISSSMLDWHFGRNTCSWWFRGQRRRRMLGPPVSNDSMVLGENISESSEEKSKLVFDGACKSVNGLTLASCGTDFALPLMLLKVNASNAIVGFWGEETEFTWFAVRPYVENGHSSELRSALVLNKAGEFAEQDSDGSIFIVYNGSKSLRISDTWGEFGRTSLSKEIKSCEFFGRLLGIDDMALRTLHHVMGVRFQIQREW